MGPEDKVKLDRALELSEENNKMLKKLVRVARWNRVLRIIYLVIIIGSAVGIYYFTQPYLDQVLETYSGFKQNLSSFQNNLPW